MPTDKPLLQSAAAFFCALAATVFFTAIGKLTELEMAWAVIILCLAAAVGMRIVFERARSKRRRSIGALRNHGDATSRATPSRTARKLKLIIIVLVTVLIFGIWQTQGAPLLPRITGIAINLAFIAACVAGLRSKRT